MSRPALCIATPFVLSLLLLAGCGGGSSNGGGSTSKPTETEQTKSDPSESAPVYVITDDTHRIYAAECALCHGETGRADTDMARMLSVKPRSFVTDDYKFITDDMTHAQKVSKIIELIDNGIPEAMMPSYKATITNEQAGGLAELILSMREK